MVVRNKSFKEEHPLGTFRGVARGVCANFSTFDP